MNYLLSDIASEPWSWPWWGFMVSINIISCIIFIVLLVRMILTNKSDPKNRSYRIMMMIFGTIYVIVAMYRSVFVSSYTGNKAWFNSMANSMFVIRCFATFAEISFACLIGLGLRHMNEELELPKYVSKLPWFERYLKISPYIIITCLSVAQCFAWSGLLTQYVFLFAIEETLWTLGFVSVLPLILVQVSNLFRNYRTDKTVSMYKAFTMILAIFTVGYVLFQICYQLPFGYYLEIANDMANGVHYGFTSEAFNRILYEINATRSFDEWGGIGFFIWHSGYFSICVWMNVFFANGPRLLNNVTRN